MKIKLVSSLLSFVLVIGAVVLATESDAGDCIETVGTPVCGTDGISYATMCHFESAQTRDPELKKIYDGSCGDPPRVRCGVITLDLSPHCGNDGKVYDNGMAFRCYQKAYPNLSQVQCSKSQWPYQFWGGISHMQ